MGILSRNRRNLRWAIVLLSVTAFTIGSLLHVGLLVHADQAARPSIQTIKLGAVRPGSLYAFTLGLKDAAQLQGTDAVLVTVKDAQGEIESKWLHVADLDLYLTIRPRAAGQVTVSLSSASTVRVPEISATLHKILRAQDLKPSTGDVLRGVIAAAPNDSWQKAQPFELGQTIYGSDDERPYAPFKGEDGYAAMLKGFQWFRFTFRENKPRLVYFVLNVTDRDVPARRGHLSERQRRCGTA